MSTVTVPLGGNAAINQDTNDSILFIGLGTLNIAGTPQNPITVTLSSVGGVGVLETINITYADVTLGGTAGVSALAAYNVGAGGTLRLQSTIGIAAGSSIKFTAPRSHLVVNSGVNLNQLGNISVTGFGPGSNIDLAGTGFSSYNYTDAAGAGTGGTLTLRDAGGNAVGSISLTDGDFTAASFYVHPDTGSGTLVDFATNVSTLSATPANADLSVGGTVVFNLGTTAPVTIAGGTPTLTLNDGGTATYDASHSTATNLVFNYTVQAGQNTPDLAVTAVNLNNATATDLIGSPVSLAGGIGNPAGTLQIDTTAPIVSSVSTTPGSGLLAAGQIVAINLTLSEAVTVSGGSPTLTLNDLGIATYDAAHSTATNLAFTYTVQPGQNTPDLGITGYTLNNATIIDGAGNAANLAAAVTNPLGTLQIDTTPPTITGISTTPASGAVAAGQVVAINLTPSEAVTIAGGTPTLSLNNGGTATYDPVHSTTTNLVFTYAVQSGQSTPDLFVTAASLNGATMTDAAGNTGAIGGAVGNPPGTLQVDTIAPTIASISATPSNASLSAGQVVAINVATNEAVAVSGGTPTLTLNDGGTATYDPNSSTATNLVFKYTVQSGQNTPDLSITGANLNGARIADPAGNAADLSGIATNPGGTLLIDTTAPTITAVSTSPSSGSLAVGQIVSISLTPSEAVTVAGGTPTLTLNSGGTAIYDPNNSTATNLVFTYTVQAGQNAPDLTVTGSSLNGATITDPAGNPANLAGANGNPPGTLQIITSPPTVTSISTTPNNAAIGAGQMVSINVTTSGAVAVAGGTPTLTLNDGGTATYDANSSTATNLVFKYTVQSGQNTSDLAITGLNLNSATVTDPAGNTANLSGSVTNPAGTLQVDTTAPTIVALSTSPNSGALAAGQVVSFNLTPSEGVLVASGTPTLALNSGGTATYDPNNSTATNLVFTYTVQSGQNAPDLTVIGYNLNGATIADPAGNPVDMTGAVGNPPGTLQIITSPPTVTSISTTPASGTLAAGQIVSINVTSSTAVTVAGGTPTLALNDGGTATYDAGSSTATNLVFKYTVQSGQNTSDLAITGSNLNGATITDVAGNFGTLAGVIGNPPGILQIDTTAPTITSVSTSPASGSLTAGQVVSFNLTPSEAVAVAGGAPTLTLNDGGTATYDQNSSTAVNLVFKYIVRPGDNTPDLTVTGANLNGATVTDPAGNPASLAGAIGNPQGILQIDTSRPAITSVYDVMTTPGSGDLGAGSNVALTLTLTGNVTISGGTPTLTLSDGGIATFDPNNSTSSSLVFRHTVQPGQNTPDLAVTAISLNGATALDGSGNAADLSDAVTNPGGILQVDTTTPTITSVSTTPGNGSFSAGQVVTVAIATSEAVTVAGGTPTLSLNDGGTAAYDATRSTPTNLVFTYTVQPGQNTADLTITGTSLNGATIADGAGNAVNLAAAVGNPSGTLQIDTAAPAVVAVATQPGSGTVVAGQVVSIIVTPSEAVAVNRGTPSLTLSDGGIAVYDSASSTATSLVFKYTVQPGDIAADLTVTGANLNGASITDPAGNTLDLTGAIGNPPGILQINTVPVVTSVVADPPNGDLKAGAIVTLQVTMSGPVTVTGGSPTLSLNDGGIAAYDAASSTPTMLVFRHTVQTGQNTPDLAVSAAFLNGTVITDGMGRNVSLSGAIGNPAGILQIDTIAPTAVSVVTGGSLEAGGVYTITTNVNEPVTVAGGPFSLSLANGGFAVYNPLLSTPTALVSSYTVPAGSDLTTDDVQIVGYNENGASALDGAGNSLDVPSVAAAIAAAQGNLSDVIMAAVNPTTVDVYRFFETANGTHFYTEDAAERAMILATRPDLVPEGPNGVGLTAVSATANDPNALPVYRFFDLTHGTQFLTASLAERNQVIATRRDLVYEPNSGFLEHVTEQAGDTAVYRFFDNIYGTHFYTSDDKERATIIATRPDLVFEGVGFYEPTRNPAA